MLVKRRVISFSLALLFTFLELFVIFNGFWEYHTAKVEEVSGVVKDVYIGSIPHEEEYEGLKYYTYQSVWYADIELSNGMTISKVVSENMRETPFPVGYKVKMYTQDGAKYAFTADHVKTDSISILSILAPWFLWMPAGFFFLDFLYVSNHVRAARKHGRIIDEKDVGGLFRD